MTETSAGETIKQSEALWPTLMARVRALPEGDVLAFELEGCGIAIQEEFARLRSELASQTEVAEGQTRQREKREKWEILSVMNLDTDPDLFDQDHRDAALAKLVALKSELAAAKQGREWIACSDQMPEDERRVLVSSPDAELPGVFEAFRLSHFALSHRWQRGGGRYCAERDVTHWMPLPLPPTEQAKDT